MPQRPSADRTAKLLLWHQKEGARFRADPRHEAPPLDFETVFKLALGRPVEFSDPALQRASAATLRAAAATHVRQFHFRADATPYEVLGVTPEANEQEIKEAFRFLMQLIHPDRQGARREWPDAFAARANHAYTILRHSDSRATFDREEAERTARSRLAQGAAAVAATPQADHWPRPGRGMRGPPPRAALPEWLTAGVGGFARAHPAVVAFGMLIGIAVLVVVFAAWERGAGRLAREGSDPGPGSLQVPVEAAAVPVVAAPDPVRDAIVSANAPPPPPPPAPGSAEPRAQANQLRPAQRDEPPATVAPKPEPVALAVTVVPTPPPSVVVTPVAPAVPAATAPLVVPVAPAPPVSAAAQAPKADEIEAQFVAFVDAFNGGRLDAMAALFDDDAQTGQRQGRAAIRREYDDLFRRSDWRRMNVSRMSWKLSGDVAQVRAEGAVRTAWRDGREAEERLALDMDLARRDGRVVIIRLAQRAGAP